jgi:hypothetical protein
LQAQASGVINGRELEYRDQDFFVDEKLKKSDKFIRAIRTNPWPGGRALRLHALMAIPYTLFDASSIASANVGWA